MSIVATTVFTSTTETVTKDKLNGLVANLLTDYNGNIQAVNLASKTVTGAKIADSTIDLTTKVTGILSGANQTTTVGTVTASEGVVVDSNKDISAFRNIGMSGTFTIGATAVTAADALKIVGITNGTQTASKAVVADANVNTGVSKVTELHIGASGSEVQVTATPAEINQVLDGVSANVTDTNLNTLTAGATSDGKALHGHGWAYDSGWFTGNLATLYTKAHSITITFPADVLEIRIYWRASSGGSYVVPIYSDSNTDGSGSDVSFDGTNIYIQGQTRFAFYVDSSGSGQSCGNGELRIVARKLI